MKGKALVAVTIPIFKSKPEQDEIISLNQCLKVLGTHPIVFFCAQGMDVSNYISLCKNKANIMFETFHEGFFKDEKGYNKLLLSKAFYKRFLNFKFILIHKLNSFVFKDDLEFWCNQKYDYLGAPVFQIKKSIPKHNVNSKSFFNPLTYSNFLKKTGLINFKYKHIKGGSFSLRKVAKCYRVLSVIGFNPAPRFAQEDTFWPYTGNILYPYFKLPEESEALKFSLEGNPAEMTGILKSVPFGCVSTTNFDMQFLNKYNVVNLSIQIPFSMEKD
jgi:hypothetical protein